MPDDGLVLAHDARDGSREHAGVGGRAGAVSERRARLVEPDRIVLGRLVAVTLVRDHVHQRHEAVGRGCRGPGLFERLLQLLEVVSVYRAEVLEAHLGPEHGRHDEPGEGGVEPLDQAVHQPAGGHPHGERLHAVYHRLVLRVSDETLAPVGEEADVLGDGHAVVVEDDDELVRVEVDDVVERLEAGAGGHRAVADDGDGPRRGVRS